MATKPKTTIKKTPQKTNSSNAEAVTQGKTVEPKQKTYRVKVSLDPNMIITVKNGFHGPLVYKSRKTQESTAMTNNTVFLLCFKKSLFIFSSMILIFPLRNQEYRKILVLSDKL